MVLRRRWGRRLSGASDDPTGGRDPRGGRSGASEGGAPAARPGGVNRTWDGRADTMRPRAAEPDGRDGRVCARGAAVNEESVWRRCLNEAWARVSSTRRRESSSLDRLTAATAMTQILAARSGTRLPAVKPPPWRLSRPPRRAHTGSRGPARRSFGEAPSAARSRSRGARHAPPRARGRRVRVGAGGLAAIGSRIVGAPRGRGRPNRPTSQRVAASSSR